jgi:hypothetical protein
MARDQVCNLLGIPLEEDMRAYDERAGAALVEGREGRTIVLICPDSLLEPVQRFGRDRALDIRTSRKS